MVLLCLRARGAEQAAARAVLPGPGGTLAPRRSGAAIWRASGKGPGFDSAVLQLQLGIRKHTPIHCGLLCQLLMYIAHSYLSFFHEDETLGMRALGENFKSAHGLC